MKLSASIWYIKCISNSNHSGDMTCMDKGMAIIGKFTLVGWLMGNPRRFKTCVGNHITNIVELVSPDRWNLVKTQLTLHQEVCFPLNSLNTHYGGKVRSGFDYSLLIGPNNPIIILILNCQMKKEKSVFIPVRNPVISLNLYSIVQG